jgi:hypothetical protein
LTGGIREGAKGEPPVAYFRGATARYSSTAPPACLELDCSRFRLRRLHQMFGGRNHFWYSSIPRLSNSLAPTQSRDSDFFPFYPRFFWHTKQSRRKCICPVSHRILVGIAVFAWIVPPAVADLFPTSGPVVSGKTARLRFGKAAAPKNAPVAMKRAIWAANQLRSKKYRYGGGHKSFDDCGYDCSGTISYVLGGGD